MVLRLSYNKIVLLGLNFHGVEIHCNTCNPHYLYDTYKILCLYSPLADNAHMNVDICWTNLHFTEKVPLAIGLKGCNLLKTEISWMAVETT